jgi:hypothetical protein
VAAQRIEVKVEEEDVIPDDSAAVRGCPLLRRATVAYPDRRPHIRVVRLIRLEGA